MFNIALRWTWNSAEADELVQEAFLKLWSRRRGIKPMTANAYLFRTLLNLCQNFSRRRDVVHRAKQWLGLDGTKEIGSQPDSYVDGKALQRAIDTLKPAQRSVLLLVEFSGLSHKEVAEVLNIPVGTVGSRRNTALAKLKEQLSD